MKPIIYNGDHLLDENNMDFSIPVEIHVCRFLKNTHPQHLIRQLINVYNKDCLLNISGYRFKENTFKIFIDSCEPLVCRMKEIEEDIIKASNFYNLILSSNTNILNSIPNSKLFLYGTTWLNKTNNDKTYLGEVDESFNGFNIIKENTLSFLRTNKSKEEMGMIPGYNLREKIWNEKDNINFSVKFYYSNSRLEYKPVIEYDGPLPNSNKMNLFNSKFSVIIENSSETNYFSEKLIDCLLTKTIPIYWGCPNISSYFDTDGMILIEDEKDFIKKINEIDLVSFYDKKIQHIENNFNIAKKYAKNYGKRVQAAIEEILP